MSHKPDLSAPEPSAPELPVPARDLLAKLDELGIPYELHEHRPVFTVAESADIEATIPGCHCRNLFVKDKKGRMFLVTAANETEIDLKKLQTVLECGRLSFGSASRLWDHLGVIPGAVNPFAIINDRAEKQVTSVIDDTMLTQARINVHPMENHLTIGLSPDDLLRFIDFCGHTPYIFPAKDVHPDKE